MLEDIGRCTNLIHSELEQLVTTAGDYAGWDDTYAFVQTGDAAFTSTNLQPATLTKLRLDLVAIADANGKVVYLYLQHYTSGAALAASPALLSHLTPRGKLLTNPSPQSSVSGMLHLPEGIMMVAARPILKSDSSGPAKGTLLFGRFLDRTEVKRLAGIVNFTMSIDNDLSEIKLDSSHRSSAGGELSEPIVSNSDKITGRAVIRDIYGETAGLVQVVQPRLIYQEGLRSVNKSFTVTALISLLFCGLLIYYLREREVERKRAEEKLSALNAGLDQQVRTRTAELKAAIQEQESFSYSVSHDLRAPLRHINSFSSMLLEDYGATLPTEARNYLERITYSTKKMGALIDHLLELSRVIRTEIRMDSIDLSALARDIANMLKETEPQREVKFIIEDGIQIQGDPILTCQLLENLIGNAWKYSSCRTPAQIEFGRSQTGGEDTFFVRDNGAGFDMAYSSNLFKMFHRLHGVEFDGTGIGLATALRIVRRHGGRIWAEGAVDRGATFFFTIPDLGARDDP